MASAAQFSGATKEEAVSQESAFKSPTRNSRIVSRVRGEHIVRFVAWSLFVCFGLWMIFKLVWWVLYPIHVLVIVYIVAHALVKIYTKTVEARAKVLAKEIEVLRRRHGRKF